MQLTEDNRLRVTCSDAFHDTLVNARRTEPLPPIDPHEEWGVRTVPMWSSVDDPIVDVPPIGFVLEIEYPSMSPKSIWLPPQGSEWERVYYSRRKEPK